MIIRAATADDAPGLTACIVAAYAPYAAQGLNLPPVSAGIAEDIRDHRVWVAVDDGAIVGGAVLHLNARAHLANLAVHPEAGGHGIGRALIDTAHEAARKAGHAQMYLATHVDMEQAQALYQRLGWYETGRDGNKAYFCYDLNDN